MADRRQMHLNANVIGLGYHPGAWRYQPQAPSAFVSKAHLARIAQIAEAGTFDAVFFADVPALREDIGVRAPQVLDPTVALGVIGAVSEHLGLIGTVSTSYEAPYNVARRWATLDHLTDGRAAWNVVSTAHLEAPGNFGAGVRASTADRYRRAEEFIDVVLALWASWEDAALVADVESGTFVDTARVHPIDHHGEFFDVTGPLNMPRPPYERPLIVQAGGSEQGKDLAARSADLVFAAQLTVEGARRFYSDIRSRAVAAGRDADAIRILPGVATVLGDTEVAALARFEELERLSDSGEDLARLARLLHVEPSELDLDQPVPSAVLESGRDIQGTQGFLRTIAELVASRPLTVRELLRTLGGGGHHLIVGTPEQAAQTLIEWFETGAADGFNLLTDTLPEGLETFVEHVVPILRKRGVFRTEYSGATIRDHYGVPVRDR